MTTTSSRAHDDADGQATAELAVVLPVLAIIALAVVQVALVGKDQILVWHAAREAGRQAAVEPDADSARQAAVAATPGLDPDRLGVTVEGGSATGQLVVTRLTYRAATDVPVVGVMIDDRVLEAEVVFRVE